MPWFRHWIEEEYQVGAYILTICCQEMKFLARNVIPGITISKDGKVTHDVVVLIDHDQNKYITTIRYCPHCGAKVQLRRLPDG